MDHCKTILLFVLLLGTVGTPNAAELIVESTGVGSLDSVIFADTLPNGDRVDLDRIYILRRATKYQLAQTIQWSGYDIRIKAESGSGARPMIIFDGILFWADETSNLTLDGLHLNGKLTLDIDLTRIIRIQGHHNRVEINNCLIEEAGQSAIRLNADSICIYVRNSIFNRLGDPVDPPNGRFLDNRGYIVDTIFIENCLIYAVTARFYRDGGGSLNHGIFNQNTFWGSGSNGFSFGPIGDLHFTNNIVANPVFLGEIDTIPEFAITIDTFIAGMTDINVSYNNFFIEKAFDTLLPANRFGGEPVLSINGDFLGPEVSKAIIASGMGATNISEVLTFTNPPNVPAQFIAASADEFYDNAGTWDFSDLTPSPIYSEPGIDRYATYHDFSYRDTAMSYTAGTQGQPLGAHLNFCNYPQKLELSLDTLPSGTYFALDSLILHGTNLIADSLQFVSKNIIELNPTLEGQVGKKITLITDPLLCDEFIKDE